MKTKARGKGEGSITEDSRGYWRVRLELPPDSNGNRRRKDFRRKSKAAALKEMRKLQAELEKTGNLETSSVKLSDWSEHWLAERAKKLAPNTVSGYRVAFRDYINPALGKKRLDKLTPLDVSRLHNSVMGTPKDKAMRQLSDPPDGTEYLSSTYALLIHNALSGALKMAKRQGKVSRNVCELVDRPTKRATNEKALTVDEAVTLLLHLATHPNGAMWASYLLTGARRGEIIGLEVDRVGDILDLSWQIQRVKDIESAPADYEYRHIEGNLYFTRPKSNAGWRTPPLVEPLATILRRYIGDRTEGLVFQRAGRPWDPADASKEWKIVLKEAGLPDDVTLHGARHTVVDLLYEAEVPEAVIMEIVGHSSRAVTRSYRSRGNQKIVRDALERMSGLLYVEAV
ncbi:site-specific integrase [Arthrobacter sp. GMC3]|uniref:tyrosine-type recombinase/integrase n=1 Tax=Arthrobacter sp. GMC3 TaxID=2058894 RepID=UPI000CE307C2|nr:site-specific integrase [Arthrobacter sp. GMC3]